MRCQLELQARDGQARATRVTLPRGSFHTPIFMPVGTHATVKAMTVDELEQLGAEVILSNAYHLYARPGHQQIAALGGLHRFMGWPRLVLTDSGGFQVFSLRQLMSIDDDGVVFRSHIDGSRLALGPQRSMEVQAALGSDIAMAFDHCPPSDASPAQIAQAMARTTRWARVCVDEPRPDHQARFAIVQGGLDLSLRREHLDELAQLPFEGVALGGLSVGETPDEMHGVVSAIAPLMPVDRPRYLMGVGRPEDLVRAIGSGIDMFDCVLPTRNARNGHLFTRSGRVVISNARYRTDGAPIDESCGCSVCQRYSRAYLRHLYSCRELLFFRLATMHNLHHVIELVRQAREAIIEGGYDRFARAYFAARADAAAS